MKSTYLMIFLVVSMATLSCKQKSSNNESTENAAENGAITAEEARAIAKEAYIYGYPLIDSYRIQYAYFISKDNTEYKAPWNVIRNIPRVYTPEDKAVQTPNSDTPYSMVGLDLRTEPIVLTIPPIENGRYFSVQLVDAYTHNFHYLGTRTTGNKGGNYLVAGPNWKGELPKGITEILPSETEFVLGIYRTQLFNPKELANVKAIQDKYKVQPLSQFLGQPAPPATSEINFITPLSVDQQRTSLQSFHILNFLLQFCPVDSTETALRQKFEKIGIKPGANFDSTNFSPEILAAVQNGIRDAWNDYDALKSKVDKGEFTSGDFFGTREYLKNNYLYRLAGAVIGIYGNSKDEAMYPFYSVDADGAALNGANKYTVRFEPGKLPPVNSFWSMTMYEMPSSLLVANSLNRYLINSPMLPSLKKDADGSITLYIQNESPGKDKESNWLPSPKGAFMMVLRLYWPKEEALNGKWIAPKAVKKG